ncbi:MAG: DUF4105 domain-containing protein [Oleiphilaceae bacterium]|nr:DUF4105 domain-containing protein [Oleiphilaceae bacterium]
MGTFKPMALLLAGLSLISGCAAYTPPPTDTDNQGSVTLETLRQSGPEAPFSETLQRLDIGPDRGFESFWEVAGRHGEPLEVAFSRELEQFTGDRHYPCRRPLLYRYFVSRFGQPSREAACQNDVPFLVTSGMEGSALTWVNPERVKAIHVLFAGQGDGIVSRFGHLSFRLIICPEERHDASCDENLYEHLVLGYRAHVDDLRIDYWSGLFGEYRAHLFANPFMEVYREYAIGEFRELYSLPLTLSRRQTRQMVRELSEIHWSYAGDYRFLTNNCSSIAQKYLLHSAGPMVQDRALHDIRWRPDYFFQRLRDSRYTVSDTLSDLEEAEREGYYFPSTRPVYENAFELVRAARNGKGASSLEAYLVMPVPRRLNALRENEDYLGKLLEQPRLMEAQRLLEELALIRTEKTLLASLSGYFSDNPPETLGQKLRPLTTAEEFRTFDQCVLQPVMAEFRPRQRLSGIPGPGQSPTHASGERCGGAQMQARLKGAIRALNDIDPERWSGVDDALTHWAGSLEAVSILSELAGEY